MKKIIVISILLFLICNTISSQDIFSYIKTHNMESLSNGVIKKTRKQLKIEKHIKLFTIPVIKIEVKENFTGSSMSDQIFIDNIKPDIYNRVLFIVYDDALNVITYANQSDKHIVPVYKPDNLKIHLFVQYFVEKNPDYIFEMMAHSFDVSIPIFISYKEGKIDIIYLEQGSDQLTIIPLYELKNVELLNPIASL